MNFVSAQSAVKPEGMIEKMHPSLDAIIKKDAKLEVIATGFKWVEGPVWVESLKMLLFSEVFTNRIYKWTAKKGVTLYLEPAGFTGVGTRGGELGSNGLAIDDKGNLVLCQHGDRSVVRMDAPLDKPKSTFKTLAKQYNGKKFDSPNDLAIKSNGDIYFTDPPYGLEKGTADPTKEALCQGVYKISPNGVVTLLTDTITRPNGIAFFPDEKSLIIANSDPEKPYLYIYDVDEKKGLTNGRIFHDASNAFQKENRTPDGIKIDGDGNVFAPGPGGIWIINKKGLVLGRIKVNVTTSNCAFANNYKTLFITADHHLLKMNLR
ncbi:MAG: SMP-30/gluconolactonase/LRE family protein [Sphingobacteriaceae bacterium]